MKPDKVRLLMALLLTLVLCACGAVTGGGVSGADSAPASDAAADPSPAAPDSGTMPAAVYKIGICTDADNPVLHQIMDNLRSRLGELEAEHNVSFQAAYANCSADPAVLTKTVQNMIADGVDLMVAVFSPAAVRMRDATQDHPIPVVFAAVSDPEGENLAASNEAPGGNLTGTSDSLNTTALLDLIFTLKPDAAKIGLLYDPGQDSAAAMESARTYLQNRYAGIVERTGTSVDEITLAAKSLAADGVDVVFTPADHTVMRAESSICEIFTEAGIPHFAGADAFARSGAFLGYGVDYAALGAETANMVSEILLSGADPASMPIRTFESRIATVNTQVCAALGMDYAAVEAALSPLCAEVRAVTTQENTAAPAESTGAAAE